MKFKNYNGITLIALVITIIILLILAGVSINLVSGENGIVNKAQQALDKTKRAKVEEEIWNAWAAVTSDYYMDLSVQRNIEKESYYTKDRLNSELSNGKVNKISFVDNGTTIIAYEDNTNNEVYSVTIANDKAIISGYSSISGLASIITESNYGQRINYSANGITDWRIFYNDGLNVFLISTDYIKNNLIDLEKIGAVSNGEYSVYWSQAPSIMQDMSQKDFFKANFLLNPDNPNARCISELLNTDNWNEFVNSKYADYAIGGASIEMWMASWNEKYPNEKLHYNNPTQYGYYVGIVSNPITSNINPDELKDLQGFKLSEENNMYWPHKETLDEGKCNAYWLASPANNAGNSGNYILNISRWPYVDNNSHDTSTRAIRPVIRLKAETMATQNDEGIWILD